MSKEAMQMALEALESCEMSEYGRKWVWPDSAHPTAMANVREAINALRQAIEQERLEYWNAVEGWVKIDEMREHFNSVNCGTIYAKPGEGRVPLYTRPQPTAWVSLTDEEAQKTFAKHNCDISTHLAGILARAIKAALRSKNT